MIGPQMNRGGCRAKDEGGGSEKRVRVDNVDELNRSTISILHRCVPTARSTALSLGPLALRRGDSSCHRDGDIQQDCASARQNSTVHWNQQQRRYSALSYGLGYSRRSDYKFSLSLVRARATHTHIHTRTCACTWFAYTVGFVLTRYGNYLQLSRMSACRKARCRAGQIRDYRGEILRLRALHTPRKTA